MSGPSSADTRAATIQALDREHFDLVIIGGGITGAGIARDAAMRGLRVALFERDDFGSGTSGRSSRLIHGGLRYLEHGQLHLVYESSRERRILLRIAPHLVRPLRFVWPLFEYARIPPWKLHAGLLLYDALALFRNIANHHSLSAKRVSAIEPAIRQLGLRGGASYYDAITDDMRLTLATIRAAVSAGAVVLNHAPVRELRIENSSVRGICAECTLTGRSVEVEAHTIVNAAGPWGDAIRRLADPAAPPTIRGTRGAHIAVPRERVGNRGALTILSPIDSRVMFIIPAGSLTIIGTTDTDYDGPPDAVHATADDVAYLLRSANAYFPAAHLAPADVVSAWAGVRPLAGDGATPSSAPDAISREHAITWTRPGLLTVSGGKLTTYRAMAQDVVDRVAAANGRSLPHAATGQVRLPGGDIASLDAELAAARAELGMPEIAEHLVYSYGAEWRDVWAIVGSNPALAAHVAPGLPYIVAELHWGVEHEMAHTLADLLIRRLHVAFETHDHGLAAAPAVARVVAPLLGWRADQIDAELARYTREVGKMFGVQRDESGGSAER